MWDFLAMNSTTVALFVLVLACPLMFVLGHGHRHRHRRDAERNVTRSIKSGLTIGIATLVWSVVPAHAGDTVVVQPGVVEPPVLHTTTGTDVEFENRTGRAIHLEFEGNRAEHEVRQSPVKGPFRVIFRRPGTHRYVVHVYDVRERTLIGAVEVAEDEEPSSETPDCGPDVKGVCVEQ